MCSQRRLASCIVASSLAFMALASIASAATEKVLYSFTGGSDGQFPNSGLVFDKSGNLFGTTESGSTGSVVFELSPNSTGGWTETVIHTFSQNTEGYSPNGPLAFDTDGNLYGTTSNGGLYSAGVVYELSPVSGGGWTYTVIHNFGANNRDGAAPTGMTVDSAGNLYGTTYGGGVNGGGIAYQLSPSAGLWTQSILHSFPSNSKDGSNPSTPLALDAGGNLYGATRFGGNTGTVFKLTLSSGVWGETVIHRFSGRADGIDPSGRLVVDASGAVYGATLEGPLQRTTTCTPNVGCGTVFKLIDVPSTGWSEALRYDLPRIGGIVGVAIDGSDNVYATEEFGDRILELSPNSQGGWAAKAIYTFTGGNDGKLPTGSLVFDSASDLYGTTFGGGVYGAGVVFEITP